MTHDPPRPGRAPHRWRRRGATAGLIALSWLAGAVVVRVGLDLADRRPWSPLSEWIYLLVALCALTVAVGGSVLAVRRHRQRALRAEATNE